MWAGYTRVSRVGDRGERLISPQLQADRIQSYASSRGIGVHMLDPELDVSGGRVDRPILTHAIRGVENGTYEGIIVAQLDRLSRMDITDALATIRNVEAAGGQIIAVAENFDVATPEGRMARTVILSMAEMQLDRYKLQFRAAKRQAVERGVWPTRTVPTGYRKRHDRRLEPDPQKARLVARAFELRAAGHPFSTLGTLLKMSQSSARKIIQNRVYLGEIRVGEWANPHAHKPLVDRALFDAAQSSEPPRPPRGKVPALLIGICVCAGCGGSLTVDSKKGQRYYRCLRQVMSGGRRCVEPAIISAPKVESYVEALCLPAIGNVTVTAKERGDALQRAHEGLSAAESELAAYQHAESVSGLGADMFLAGMRPRVEAVEAARKAVAEARLRNPPVPHGGELLAVWPDLSIEEKRHLLRGLLSGVVVLKGRGPCEVRVRVLLRGDGPVELGVPGAEHVE